MKFFFIVSVLLAFTLSLDQKSQNFFLSKEEHVQYLNNEKSEAFMSFGRVLGLACPYRHLSFLLLYSNSQFQHLYDFISTGEGQMKVKNSDTPHLALKFPLKNMRCVNMFLKIPLFPYFFTVSFSQV